MKYLLLVFIVLTQTVQEPPRHDKYKDDPHAYCWSPKSSGTSKVRERDPHAHVCSCHLICQIGPNNEVIGDQEDSTCELYCTRERCTCHIEEPCERH